jgi:hypothetical protein
MPLPDWVASRRITEPISCLHCARISARITLCPARNSGPIFRNNWFSNSRSGGNGARRGRGSVGAGRVPPLGAFPDRWSGTQALPSAPIALEHPYTGPGHDPSPEFYLPQRTRDRLPGPCALRDSMELPDSCPLKRSPLLRSPTGRCVEGHVFTRPFSVELAGHRITMAAAVARWLAGREKRLTPTGTAPSPGPPAAVKITNQAEQPGPCGRAVRPVDPCRRKGNY